MTQHHPPAPEPGSISTDAALVEALRGGDERAFTTLIERHHPALVRLAVAFLGDHAVAEEVVQETWLALFLGIHRFEQRSSLKTWLFRVLTYQARRRAEREGRMIPFSSLEPTYSPAIEPERFLPAGHRYAGHWAERLADWAGAPEEQALARETRTLITQAIAGLPPNQRTVITLRDIEGLTAQEVCDILGISDVNQRVLLHRARSRVRRALVAYLTGTGV